MNRYTSVGLSLVFVSVIILTGCDKLFPPHPKIDLSGGGSPSCPTSLKITASDSTPVVGSDVTIRTDKTGPDYQWSGPGNFFLTANSGQDSETIHQIMIYQSGWYYCEGIQTNCSSTVADSVYLDVKYQQGTPSCSLANQQITNTGGLPDFSAATVFKSYGGYGAIQLDADDGVTDYLFVFNPNNFNTEPKDGVYYTTNDLLFSNGEDADAIDLTINYYPYYLTSDPGQKVFVSHVNGKLRISFCSLTAEGSGVSGSFSGQVTEQ